MIDDAPAVVQEATSPTAPVCDVPAQVKSLDRQLSDTERRLQEMVSASQRQTSLAQNEVIVSYDSRWHTQYQQTLAVSTVCCMLSECPTGSHCVQVLPMPSWVMTKAIHAD